jgi:hypothetical protein
MADEAAGERFAEARSRPETGLWSMPMGAYSIRRNVATGRGEVFGLAHSAA